MFQQEKYFPTAKNLRMASARSPFPQPLHVDNYARVKLRVYFMINTSRYSCCKR